MTNDLRIPLLGVTCVFTVCLADRRGTLLTDHIEVLRFAYAKTIRELPVACHAMVVLPDHLHAIWTLPAGDTDFAERWRQIKVRFSRGLGADVPRRGDPVAKDAHRVWQRRFRHQIVRHDAALAAAVAYCRFDPVRHGLVDDAADWVHSSFHRQLRRDGRNGPPDDIIPRGFAGRKDITLDLANRGMGAHRVDPDEICHAGMNAMPHQVHLQFHRDQAQVFHGAGTADQAVGDG